MQINRYYAQCTETNPMFESQWSNSWQVFDREFTDKQGGVISIALCVNKAQAVKIRDALNFKENES